MIISNRECELLEWNDVISLFTNFCVSEGAKELYRTIEPCSTANANLQTRRIDELKEALIRDVTPDLSPLFPVEKSLQYAAKGGVLSLDELYRIGRSCTTMNALIAFFGREKEYFPLLHPYVSTMHHLEALEELLSQSITDDVQLNTAFYPHIGKIQKQITSLEQEIQSRLHSMVHSAELRDHVQETIVTTRSEKYVVLIKSSAKGKTQGSIIDTSSSGATYYFEPAVIAPMNTKLLHLKNDLNRELFTIMQNLSERAGSCATEMTENLATAYRLDFYNACARLSFQFNYAPVTVTTDYTLHLYNARHPLLAADSTIDVVPNSIALDAEHGGMIISGANTGGKTILLKTVALTVLLARFGLHAPAGPDSHVGCFRKIMVDIGDDQNLKKSLSTFSGQILSVNRMVDEASPETLLLIDEIISGTNPRHAAALAMAILAHFSARKARAVISTHYPELKEYAHEDSYYRNASVSFNTESLAPTYRLLTGTPGTSYAFEIARNYGMPHAILERAAHFLTENEIVSDQTIEQVNRLEHELEEKKAEIEKQSEALEKQRNNYYELNQKLRKRIQEAKEESALGIVDAVEKLKQQILSRLHNDRELSESEAQQMFADLDTYTEKARESARNLQEKRITNEYAPFNEEIAAPGMNVFIVPLEKRGTIDALDTRKREAVVTLGAIKSRYSFDKLRMVESSGQQDAPRERPSETVPQQKSGNAAEITIQTSENTTDLRGMRVDEALLQLDRDLDRFLTRGFSAAVIIHGHGSGALKSAVREHLRKQPFVHSFRPGEQSEGGDGVSIVSL